MLYFKISQFDDNDYCCSAYIDGTNVGYCKFYLHQIDGFTVEYIYVYEEYRRCGFAIQIINYLKTKYTRVVWNQQFTDVGRLWYDSYIKKYG